VIGARPGDVAVYIILQQNNDTIEVSSSDLDYTHSERRVVTSVSPVADIALTPNYGVARNGTELPVQTSANSVFYKVEFAAPLLHYHSGSEIISQAGFSTVTPA
jgi:hypothetical protein